MTDELDHRLQLPLSCPRAHGHIARPIERADAPDLR